MPFKASGEEILSRSPPDLKVKPKIPEGSALVTEASKKTKEWSRSSSQDLYMELNEWDYMSDKRWPAFEDAAKEINKLFYDDVPKSCTCPKGEADISDLVMSQLTVPVWQVVQEFYKQLRNHFLPKNIVLELEILKEPYSSQKGVVVSEEDTEKTVSNIVRSDQIMIVTPFKISPDGELSQVTETKQYNYVERGVPWSRTNEQSFKLGKVGVIIEIKDYGRIKPEAFKSFAAKQRPIGSTSGDFTPEELATQAQMQQGSRYMNLFKSGQLVLTDYRHIIIAHSPGAHELAETSNPTATTAGRRPERRKVAGMTSIVQKEPSQPKGRMIKLAVVKPKEMRKAMAFLAFIACQELLAAHGLAVDGLSGNNALGDMTKRMAAVNLEAPQDVKRANSKLTREEQYLAEKQENKRLKEEEKAIRDSERRERKIKRQNLA